MAARTQITINDIYNFEKELDQEGERFRAIRKDMDNFLNSFIWDDPIAHKFKADYNSGLEPLNAKLLPAMERYEKFLHILGEKTRVYLQK